MGASESELKKRVSTGEARSKICGWAVVAGLVVEVALAATFRGHTSWIENWAPVLADVLVALGVFGEIHFAGVVSRSEEELRLNSEERVAAANNAAAQASKEAAEARERTAEIEKLTAWRRIDSGDKAAIIERIRSKAISLDVLIEFERQDIEALMHSREIGQMFFDAGLKTIRSNSNSFISGDVFGAIIATSDERYRDIIEAFTEIDRTIVRRDIDLSKHLPTNERAPNFYIFVATRLPPFFSFAAKGAHL